MYFYQINSFLILSMVNMEENYRVVIISLCMYILIQYISGR